MIVLLVLVLLFTGGHVVEAAMLHIENGQLTGATGVQVGLDVYDVEFLDGTCIEIFSGCNDISDFLLTSMEAEMASTALLRQVFNFKFDSDPSLTFGCENSAIFYGPSPCSVLTPYKQLISVGRPAESVGVIETVNRHNRLIKDILTGELKPSPPDVVLSDATFSRTSYTGSRHVWAQWSVPAAVPVPNSVLLMATGLLGLGGVQWWKKSFS